MGGDNDILGPWQNLRRVRMGTAIRSSYGITEFCQASSAIGEPMIGKFGIEP